MKELVTSDLVPLEGEPDRGPVQMRVRCCHATGLRPRGSATEPPLHRHQLAEHAHREPRRLLAGTALRVEQSPAHFRPGQSIQLMSD